MRHLIALILAATAACAPSQPSSRATDTSGIKVSPGYSVTVYAAGLAEPRGLLFTPAGDLYVAEQGSGDVSKISPSGNVTRVARGFKGPHDLALGPGGVIYLAEMHADRIAAITAAGAVSTYIETSSPVDLDFSPSGELLVSELYSGRVVAYKGQAFSRVVASGLNWPHGLAFHPSGAIFVNENQGNRIVRVNPDGTVRPFAQVPRPVGLVLATSGNLYVAQPQVGTISRVAPDGRVTVLLENLKEPRDPAFDAAGDLYFAETLAGRVLKLTGAF